MMRHKFKKRPTDLNQRAKLIVDIAVGNVEDYPNTEKNQKKVKSGKLGGLKGGKARANKLSEKRRKEIALKAAQIRWRHD